MEEKVLEVNLNMGERFTLLATCLPDEHNIVYIRSSKKVRGVLTPTEQEEAEYDFQVSERGGKQMVVWSKELEDKEVTVPFTPRAFEMIQKSLKKLNDIDKLTEGHITLWDKFDMEGYNG